MFKNFIFIIIAMILGSSSVAANKKFKVRGDTLFYSTEGQFESEKGIEYEDISMFRKVLSENPRVKKIELFSYGGSITAGLEISKIVRDFNVTTTVTKECSSSCILIFLAGKNRDLKLGGLLGFHRPHWRLEGLKSYYELYAEGEGWNDPFQFASWLEKDTLYYVADLIDNYLMAGVDYKLATKSLKVPHDQIWYPSRSELISYGVLRNKR